MVRHGWVLLFAAVGSAPAHALRCDGALVSEGDHQYEVRQHCGEPVMTNQWVVYRRLDRLPRDLPLRDELLLPITIEEWLYDFGPNTFVRLLRFENGRLVHIETLGYGRD